MSICNNSIFSFNAQITPQIAKWLTYECSLTEKLQETKGDAQLELIFQNWVKPDWWDRNFLKIQDDLIFRREIIMKSHNVSCWYARTIIPKRCYDLEPNFFNRLKKESIKNLIFGNNKVQRIHIANYPVNKECLEFYWVKNNNSSIEDVLWARITECIFQQKESLYLIEIILPEFEKFII